MQVVFWLLNNEQLALRDCETCEEVDYVRYAFAELVYGNSLSVRQIDSWPLPVR